MIWNDFSLLWASVSPTVHTRQDWIISFRKLCLLGVEPSEYLAEMYLGALRGECWRFYITWAKDPICPQIKKGLGRSGLAGTSALHLPGSVSA